jgi:hypothetical protein
MLFPYTYVPHQMERMQRFVNFIFYQVWCRARKAGPYGLNLFDANPPLKEVMTSFTYDDTEAGDRFSSQTQAIYQAFAELSRGEIAQFKRWYQGNNDLERVCANNPAALLARYADIAVNNKKLADLLGTFFKGLYSQSLLDLAALRDKIGDIDAHYKKFVQINKTGKCPFCGINDLLGEYHSKREAYDHYLPKALYPFNSINFRNLVPACHHCNSSYKTSKDPAYTPKDPARAVSRRTVFYPYKPPANSIQLCVALQHSDIAKLTPTDITLQFGPDAITHEIDTWKDVYGIEERYKAKLCGADAKDWIEQFRILNRRQTYHADEFIDDIAHLDPFANANFLKRAFAQACRDIGLLAAIENYR